MRIVHALGWYFPDSVGGTEIYVAALCRRQRARGHDVHVVAPDPHSLHEHAYEHQHIPVFRYPVPAEATRDEAQAITPARGSERLAAFLAGCRPDVFHLHSIVTGLGRHELAQARCAGARTIVTHHLPGLGHLCRRGSLMELGQRPCDGRVAPSRCSACVLQQRGLPVMVARPAARLPLALSRAISRVPGRIGTLLGLPASIEYDSHHQRALNDACDAIVVLNETARRILAANGAPDGRIVLNRLGHDHPTVPRPRSTTTRPVRFGFVGRLHPTKGVLELVRAATSLSRALDFVLEIRGVAASDVERQYWSELRTLARDDGRIQFGSALPPADVIVALAHYDVLCCPSLSFENGPTVAIEAMAVGTPVIGTRVGNLVELVHDGVDGRLVEPASIAALAEAIGDVAAVPETVNRWRGALPPARTMDDVAADYERLYARLVPAGDMAACSDERGNACGSA